jgi:formate dehydrogenase maturation protein FdhE
MKRILIAALIALTFYSCADNTQQEKNLLNDILKVHDKVMNKDEVLMKNQSHLDSLLKSKLKDTAEKVNIKAIDLKVVAAQEAMENWMTRFQPDMTGKSHDEVMKYYSDQKKQVIAVDSQVNVAIKESDKYLSNHKIK